VAMVLLSVIHLVTPSTHYVAPVNSSMDCDTVNQLLNHSNVQMNFFPGVYYTNSRIFVRNVQNVMLSGSLMNVTMGTIFQCSLIGGIVVINSSNISVKGIIFENCMCCWRVKLIFQKFGIVNNFSHASLLVVDSHLVNIQHINVFRVPMYNIVLINTLAILYEISSKGIAAMYSDDYVKLKNETHDLTINNFYSACDFCQHYEIAVYMINFFGYFNAEISKVDFQTEKALYFYSNCCSASCINHITVDECVFSNVNFEHESKSLIAVKVYDKLCRHFPSYHFTFTSCQFVNITNLIPTRNLIFVYNILSTSHFSLEINKCHFSAIRGVQILQITNSKFSSFIRIRNCIIADITNTVSVMVLPTTTLHIVGPVFLSKIEAFSVISGIYMTKIFCYRYIVFSSVFASEIIRSTKIYITPKTLINITSNTISIAIFQRNDDLVDQLYPPCLLQYINSSSLTAIVLEKNVMSSVCKYKFCNSHCSWSKDVMHKKFSPLEVN